MNFWGSLNVSSLTNWWLLAKWTGKSCNLRCFIDMQIEMNNNNTHNSTYFIISLHSSLLFHHCHLAPYTALFYQEIQSFLQISEAWKCWDLLKPWVSLHSMTFCKANFCINCRFQWVLKTFNIHLSFQISVWLMRLESNCCTNYFIRS